MLFTCDVESDWGGRRSTLHGIHQMIPWLLDRLHHANVRGIFFLSTEHLVSYLETAKAIQAAGHVIGSHGHVHRNWQWAPWHTWRLDYLHSMTLLEKTFGLKRYQIPYRAPKFSRSSPTHPYSLRQQHTGVLRALWFRERLKRVFYCHPFDFLEPSRGAPNLFCHVWYRRGREAQHLVEQLLCSGGFESVT